LSALTERDAPRLFMRRARVNVGGFSILGGEDGDLNAGGLRVGFTIEKDLTPQPNAAEIIVYNLARDTRERLHREKSTKVVVEAGYATTGLTLLFAGEMREAYSRPEPDGTWATILRAGDGDKHKRASRKKTGLKPGVSFQRVLSETFSQLKVGSGNLWAAAKKGASADELFKLSGFNAIGSLDKQMEKLLDAAGLEHSVQDQELQILSRGQVLPTTATRLSAATGLEGSPEVDAQGVLSCRARIMPGLSPGYPVEIETARTGAAPLTLETGWYAFDYVEEGGDVTLYRITKTRYVGDSHGTDWVAELDCREVTDNAEKTAKKAAKAKADAAAQAAAKKKAAAK
jgi:hypothetical protein